MTVAELHSLIRIAEIVYRQRYNACDVKRAPTREEFVARYIYDTLHPVALEVDVAVPESDDAQLVNYADLS